MYLTGGPGGSIESTVFAENGPCTMSGDSITLNANSFNERANVLYVDQPIGTGFSYGDDPIYSTEDAARYVRRFLQTWLADPAFKRFQGRKLGIMTVSYGGHTGPALGGEILERNADIAANRMSGSKINVVAVGLQNAWMDARIQVKANIEYAFRNGYRQLINESTYRDLEGTSKTTICQRLNGATAKTPLWLVSRPMISRHGPRMSLSTLQWIGTLIRNMATRSTTSARTPNIATRRTCGGICTAYGTRSAPMWSTCAMEVVNPSVVRETVSAISTRPWPL